MKRYRFYSDKIKTSFVDYTEDEFKNMPDINITIERDGSDKDQTFEGKQLLLSGYKEKYVILTPIENFEEIKE